MEINKELRETAESIKKSWGSSPNPTTTIRYDQIEAEDISTFAEALRAILQNMFPLSSIEVNTAPDTLVIKKR